MLFKKGLKNRYFFLSLQDKFLENWEPVISAAPRYITLCKLLEFKLKRRAKKNAHKGTLRDEWKEAKLT